MSKIDKQFIKAEAKSDFAARVAAGDIENTSIAFIEDTGQIWAQGKYYIENEVHVGTTEPTNGEALWVNPETGELKVAKSNGTYEAVSGGVSEITEIVNITLRSNQSSSDSKLNGATVTITKDDEPTTYTWDGSDISCIMLAGVEYTISVSNDRSGYAAPASRTFTAIAGNTRNVTMEYSTTVVTVNKASNQSETFSCTATVTYGSTSTTLSFSTSETAKTVNVPTGTQYKVAFSAVSGYLKPTDITQTASDTSQSVTGTYRTTILTIVLESNQSYASDISSATASVSSTSVSTTVSSNGKVKIPYNETYTVTGSAVTGYSKPSASGTADTASRTVTLTYQTEVVTVTVKTEDSASVSGQVVTINGTAYTLTSSGTQTAKIAFGTTYSIKVDDKSGYITPSLQTGITANSVSRSITMTYETIKTGVFIEDTTGKLWATSAWTGSATANAIAVLTDNVSVLIALNPSTSTMTIDSSYSGTLENYMTAISDSTAAKADYNGQANTTNIMKLQSGTSYAAGYCNSFSLPDGTKCYLPALGELWEAYSNKSDVDAALTKVSATAMVTDSYHWSSTFWGVDGSYGYRGCWGLGWSGGGTYDYSLNNGNCVRPFAAYQA